MAVYRRAFLSGIICSVIASNAPFFAQGVLPAELKEKIIRTIGAQPDTVEIALVKNVITVSRINSNMNQSTHAGRDNEANAIGAVVSKEISGLPEYAGLHTIRVQYVVRSPSDEGY